MKNVTLAGLLLVVAFNLTAYAADMPLMDTRNGFSAESKELKALLTETKDVILMSSMWDSCILTMTQLDAYFYMAGIFNAIKKGAGQAEAVHFLTNWLKIVKDTAELNMKSLDAVTQTIDPKTKEYKERLRGYYSELHNKAAAELDKLSLLAESLTIR